MQITLRLNYPEDVDLILMRECEKRKFCSRIVECVSSYAKGRHYIYSFPVVDNDKDVGLPRSTKVNLVFQEAKNPEVVIFLKKYETKQRISIIKSLLRASYKEYPSEQVLASLGFIGITKEKNNPENAFELEQKSVSIKDKTTSVKKKEVSQSKGESFSKGASRKNVSANAKEDSISGRADAPFEKKTDTTPSPAADATVPVESNNSETEVKPEGISSLMSEEKERSLFEMFLNM